MTQALWEQAQRDFPVEQEMAREFGACFCACGCRQPDATNGRCRKCTRSRAAQHGPATPASIYNDLMDRAAPAPPKRNVIARLFSSDKRAEAEAYAREYGPDGAAFMSSMHERVAAGKPLTDAQVEAVIKSRDAERKSAKAVYRRAYTEQKRKSAHVDLSRIRIDGVPDGEYAVQGDDGAWVLIKVSRPTKGIYRGFVVVSSTVNGIDTRYGLQYPQPYRDADKHPQTYRGHVPHLVYALAQDPEGAAEAYKELMA